MALASIWLLASVLSLFAGLGLFWQAKRQATPVETAENSRLMPAKGGPVHYVNPLLYRGGLTLVMLGMASTMVSSFYWGRQIDVRRARR